MLENLNTQILNIINIYQDKEIEIEVRFGKFTNGIFESGVTPNKFHRLNDILAGQALPNEIEILDISDSQGYRKSIISGNISKFIRKEKLADFPVPEYNILLSVSREVKIEGDMSESTSTVERRKHRWSYKLSNSSSRFDLTVVNQTIFTSGTSSDRYEVELELTDLSNLQNFYNEITRAWKLINQSETLYTSEDMVNVNKFIGTFLGSSSMDDLPVIRDLTWDDLDTNSIAGNYANTYGLSIKPKGKRHLLVITLSDIWLISQDSYNLLYRTDNLTDRITKCIFLVDTLVDSFDIYRVVIIDTIIYKSIKQLPIKKLNIRLDIATNVCETLNDEIFKDVTISKPIRFGTLAMREITISNFISLFRETYQNMDLLDLPTDGLLILPIGVNLNTTSRTGIRTLKYLPESCRIKKNASLDLRLMWKFNNTFELQILDVVYSSIDVSFDEQSSLLKDGNIVKFMYDKNKNKVVAMKIDTKVNTMSEIKDLMKTSRNIYFNLKVLSVDGKLSLNATEETFIPFLGTAEYPLAMSKVILDSLYRNLPSETIIEFVLSVNGGLTPKSIRWDKTLPNKGSQAYRTWEMMNDPITESTFDEDNLTLFRHNLLRHAKSLLTGKDVIVIKGDNSLVPWKLNYTDVQTFKSLSLDNKTNLDNTYLFIQSLGQFNVNELPRSDKIYFIDWDPTALSLVDLPDNIKRLVGRPFNWDDYLISGMIPEDIRTLSNSSDLLQASSKKLNRLWFSGKLDNRSSVSQSIKSPPRVPTGRVSFREDLITVPAKLSIPQLVPINRPVPLPLTLPLPLTVPIPQLMVPILQPFPLRVPITQPLPVPLNGRHILPDDASMKINSQGYGEDIYRIGVIGDGSCFFHSYLKGFDKAYQDIKNINMRKNYVRDFRNGLADTLSSLHDSGKTWYDVILAPLFEELKISQGNYYTLDNLESLLRSNNDMGDEVYQYVATLIGVAIIVLIYGSSGEIIPLIKTQNDGTVPIVIIIGDNLHYELVAVKRNGLFQTYFTPGDPMYTRLVN